MRTNCAVSLESALGGCFFSACPRQHHRAHSISTASSLAPSSPHLCSPGLLPWPPLWGSCLQPSSNPLGTRGPQRPVKNTVWMVTTLLLASASAKNGATTPRASGSRPCLPFLHHSLPAVTHRTGTCPCLRVLSPAASSAWEACPHPPFHLCFPSLLQSWLKYHLLKEALPILFLQSWWSCYFLSWH